jgi:hypothetical protein
MSVSLTLDRKKIDKALNLWAKLSAEEQARELRKSGRSLAIRLTNVTQPYGMDAKTRKKGENAILKDIVAITKPLNSHWMNEAVRMKQLDPAAFRRRFTNKDGKVWLQEEDIELNPSNIKQFHQSMRNKGDGRTRRAGEGDLNIGRHTAANRGFILQVQQQKYIKETQKKVGIAKAGWAECAGILGGFTGVRGGKKIQGWLQKLISKYGKGYATVTDKYVELKNTVPWIGRALSNTELKKTLDIQRNTLAKSVIAIVKHNSKKAGLA